jgi:hypothetical protein
MVTPNLQTAFSDLNDGESACLWSAFGIESQTGAEPAC